MRGLVKISTGKAIQWRGSAIHWTAGLWNQQAASITWCGLFRPNFGQKTPEIISVHDVWEPLKQVLLASCDVIISSQICGSNVQRFCHIRWRILAAHENWKVAVDAQLALPKHLHALFCYLYLISASSLYLLLWLTSLLTLCWAGLRTHWHFAPSLAAVALAGGLAPRPSTRIVSLRPRWKVAVLIPFPKVSSYCSREKCSWYRANLHLPFILIWRKIKGKRE